MIRGCSSDPDLGFTLPRGQKGTGSGIRIRNTATCHLIMLIEYHLLNYIIEKTVPELIVNYFTFGK
jgi:hypothetical protein